jgi:hypothetical protein
MAPPGGVTFGSFAKSSTLLVGLGGFLEGGIHRWADPAAGAIPIAE